MRRTCIDLEAGGCLCETLADGSGAARHVTVPFVQREKT